jgi:putative FmdB family regulatory protein
MDELRSGGTAQKADVGEKGEGGRWTSLKAGCRIYSMPLFEYACRACGRRFEYLTRERETPSCPACASTELEKQLSVFAVANGPSSSLGTPSAAPCGMCGDPRGPGACSTN